VTLRDHSDKGRTQAIIWIPITLLLITLFTVCTLMGKDADKSRDTILLHQVPLNRQRKVSPLPPSLRYKKSEK